MWGKLSSKRQPMARRSRRPPSVRRSLRVWLDRGAGPRWNVPLKFLLALPFDLRLHLPVRSIAKAGSGIPSAYPGGHVLSLPCLPLDAVRVGFMPLLPLGDAAPAHD